MVGLIDQNIKLEARIRVGQDFGTIKYMGEVNKTMIHQMKNFFLS